MVFNVKLVNIITIMVIIFNDGLGTLYGTLISQMLRTSVHRTVVKEFKLLSIKTFNFSNAADLGAPYGSEGI